MTYLPRKIERYGWIPSHGDPRDYQFPVPTFGLDLPAFVDLHAKCPPIWNQGNRGSCTAHGSLRAYVFDRTKYGQADWMPSREFEYFNSRALMGTTAIDSGATVRDAIQAIANWGACPENLFPYSESVATKPPQNAYDEAAKHKAVLYQALGQDIYSLKACLAQGFVFVFGFNVYSNFEDGVVSHTGLMEYPRGTFLGGHCVCCVGYNSKNLFMCANSWGTGWGDPAFPGYFWMGPEIISNPQLASDFWVISKTAG